MKATTMAEADMQLSRGKRLRRKYMPILTSIVMIAVLLLLPTGYESGEIYQDAEKCAARVVSVDNSRVITTGVLHSGEQFCTVEFLEGAFKGQTATAFNMLSGSMETDKMFVEGDTAMVVAFPDGAGGVRSVNMIDHFRLTKEILLAGAFCLFLLLFAGTSGLRAILSFAVSVLGIWKVLIPACLKGMDPILIGFLIAAALTIIIMYLVYGAERRTVTASLGALLGLGMACLMGMLTTKWFQLSGAVMSYAETLYYSGYQHLDLTRLFTASVFVGASGAMMDLAVDITAGVNEVVLKRPDIDARQAVLSGIHIGRAAMGTMTTTLLFAYSGSYLALMMTFMAQGTPISCILNYKYVSAEILQTIVGSFGLVSVAPFTAVVSGIVLTRGRGMRLGKALPGGNGAGK